MKILHINLKAKYFNEIKQGLKTFEYRLKNGYWSKRLENIEYDEIYFKLGYPKSNEDDKIIKVPYLGYEIKTITHSEFGSFPVDVFAIKTNYDYVIQKLLNGATAFIIPMENFIDNNKNKFSYNQLPKDLEFQAIQGREVLMACFWSESNMMSYWWKLPLKIRDVLKIEDNEYCITNIEIVSTMNIKQPMYKKSSFNVDKVSLLDKKIIGSILGNKVTPNQHFMRKHYEAITNINEFRDDVFVAYYVVKDLKNESI